MVFKRAISLAPGSTLTCITVYCLNRTHSTTPKTAMKMIKLNPTERSASLDFIMKTYLVCLYFRSDEKRENSNKKENRRQLSAKYNCFIPLNAMNKLKIP